MLTLITGGARSGKSRFAQSLCEQAETVTYIATARRGEDAEMDSRIAHHRQSRPASWMVVEEPLAIVEAVQRTGDGSNVTLIDCITVWLSNLLFESRHHDSVRLEERIREQVSRLMEASQRGRVLAVTNEVGCGIVPDSPVARRFRDIQGFVNQQLAESAGVVYLMAAGIPLRIKPSAGGLQ